MDPARIEVPCPSFDWAVWHVHVKKSLAISETEESKESAQNNGDVRSLSRAVYYAHFQRTVPPVEELSMLCVKLAEDVTSCSEFRIIGGIPLVIHHIKGEGVTTEISEICCRVLYILASRDDDAKADIAQADGICVISRLIRKMSGNPSVLCVALRALRALSLTSVNRATMLQNQILEVIADVLREHSTEERIAENAVALVASVIYGNMEARIRFGETGGISLVVAAMTAQKQSRPVQFFAGLALRNLAFECPRNIARMIHAKVVPTFFDALTIHIDHQEVRNEIIAALGNIVPNDDECKREILSNAEYLQVLFDILSRSSADKQLCFITAAMLMHICTSLSLNHRSDIHRISIIAVETDTPRALRDALRSALAERNLQLVATVTSLISSLSAAENFRSTIGTTEVLSSLIQCLVENTSARSVIGPVLDSTSAILSGNDERKKMFSKAGGFAAVLIVQAEYPKTESVLEKSCRVLDIAADGQTVHTRDLVADIESVSKSVKTAMEAFRTAARLQEYGCSILIKIANTGVQETSLLNTLDVKPVVKLAVRTHAGNPAVESLGNQLLALLRSVRTGRSGSRSSSRGSNARFRSRSKTIGDRARSRNNRSKSPARGRGGSLKLGREAVLAAKAEMSPSSGAPDKGLKHSTFEFGGIEARKRAKARIALEPVYE